MLNNKHKNPFGKSILQAQGKLRVSKKQVGNLGEDLAKKFLKKRKYKILDCNYYIKGGEIDLITKDKNSGELVFVEVKTRSSNLGGWPEQAVNLIKK